jgi:3-methylcrotonyl-CoA carboxylase beta subunit
MLRASVASLNLAARPAPRRHPLPPIVPPSSLVRLPSRPNFDLVLAATIDDGAFNEFKAKYGDHLKTKVGFAHLEGHQVGILGISGPLTKQDAIKSCHFIQLCSQRDVPIIVFQNCSENSSSSSSSPSSSFEITSTLRAHAQMMTAFACSGSPVVTIATGPNNDVSAFAAAPPASGARFSFAWPQAAPPIPGRLRVFFSIIFSIFFFNCRIYKNINS